MTERGVPSAESKPLLRDWRDWNSLLALLALLVTAAAVALALGGVGWWPVRLAVTGTCFALGANALSRNRAGA
jgi:hypothetical protein